ncbi:MAG: hypothetical protein V4722_13990 [Bacteroidota bacterium]
MLHFSVLLRSALCVPLFAIFHTSFAQTKINRKALVERHTVVNTGFDSLGAVSVGNGAFAFTVDVTGLQSFPDAYANGMPLGTQSEWGWHSFTDTSNYRFEESLRDYDLNGRKISYGVQIKEPARKKNAGDWFRQNPHRLQLGSLGFELVKKDGTIGTINDIKDIRQTLNMWTGEVKSHFVFDGEAVDVSTFSHQKEDAISVDVKSKLILEGRLFVKLQLPYPTGGFLDAGNYTGQKNKHKSFIQSDAGNTAVIAHQLDTTSYFISCSWNNTGSVEQKEPHVFLLRPIAPNAFKFTCRFSQNNEKMNGEQYAQTKANNATTWQSFWTKGAAVDFAGSTDPRAKELERRVILSQWLTAIQCRGKYPPQETGLTYNSWFGKPHLEMHWWHAIHFALWNRTDALEKQMQWYDDVAEEARKIAARQGFKGARWQKMTDPAGKEAPSSVGAFILWQQPHYIYFAELVYRKRHDAATINKYKQLVFETAEFMASFAHYDKATNRYILGKGLIPAQERFKAEETFNPTYELAYWDWALNVAQQWRVRSGLPRNKQWDDVLKQLSQLPVQGDKYLATESATDSYTNPEFKTDHPSVLGAFGMLPGSKMLDTTLMQNTFNWVWNNWSWNDTWGWDFPMTAMTATRLGQPEKAIDALLMPIKTNTYLTNGHNYQDDRLRLYLPGNGGLLAAIAIMCAGYEGSKAVNPGIPKNGKWKVKWEGLEKMF